LEVGGELPKYTGYFQFIKFKKEVICTSPLRNIFFTASQSLAYVADMQAQNIPVTFAYISDAHDDHVNNVAFGPGQAGYVAQLAAYDSAFNKFFTRLGSQGINQKNTADAPELSILHMVTGDPQRTPSFVMFGDPDYFFQTTGADAQEAPGFAWNHGGVDPAINTTFLGLVGPGVARHGIDSTTWSDHADIRPTMLNILGLQDDYVHDGRTLVEDLTSAGMSPGIRSRKLEFQLLAQAYKLINAPVGYLGLSTLGASTRALAGDDATYTQIEGQLTSLATQRNALAAQIIQVLENAEFNNQPVRSDVASLLISQAEALLYQIPYAKVAKP
jgi:hypothetical protein